MRRENEHWVAQERERAELAMTAMMHMREKIKHEAEKTWQMICTHALRPTRKEFDDYVECLLEQYDELLHSSYSENYEESRSIAFPFSLGQIDRAMKKMRKVTTNPATGNNFERFKHE